MKIKTQEARLNKGTALQKLTKHTNPIKLGKKRTTLIQVLALLVAVTIASSSAAETLWVTDFGECRVLGYQSPFTHAMAASMVLGAKDMNTGCGSTPSAPNAENLLWPNISAFVGRYLAVADSGNSRVLFFAPPFGAGAAASLVYGQRDFTTAIAGHAPRQLNHVAAVASFNDLVALADGSNSRIMIYEHGKPTRRS